MKAKTIFIVIEFEGVGQAFDYPQNVPIPRIGEVVFYNDYTGIVKNIHHSTRDNLTEIRIYCNAD
jgi:hypothetical protein